MFFCSLLLVFSISGLIAQPVRSVVAQSLKGQNSELRGTRSNACGSAIKINSARGCVKSSALLMIDSAADIAYQSCRSWRLTEIQAFNHLIAAYPYSNQVKQDLIAYAGAGNARDIMKRASALNPAYSKYVTSINKWIPYLFQQYREDMGARETPYNPNQPFGKVFHQLCERLGIFSSKSGMKPPIPVVWNHPLSTPINGARRFCYKLFYVSPDGMLYSNNVGYSLRECDALALQVASQMGTYAAAFLTMSQKIFNNRDEWCWGRNCQSKWDFNSVD